MNLVVSQLTFAVGEDPDIGLRTEQQNFDCLLLDRLDNVMTYWISNLEQPLTDDRTKLLQMVVEKKTIICLVSFYPVIAAGFIFLTFVIFR